VELEHPAAQPVGAQLKPGPAGRVRVGAHRPGDVPVRTGDVAVVTVVEHDLEQPPVAGSRAGDLVGGERVGVQDALEVSLRELGAVDVVALVRGRPVDAGGVLGHVLQPERVAIAVVLRFGQPRIHPVRVVRIGDPAEAAGVQAEHRDGPVGVPDAPVAAAVRVDPALEPLEPPLQGGAEVLHLEAVALGGARAGARAVVGERRHQLLTEVGVPVGAVVARQGPWGAQRYGRDAGQVPADPERRVGPGRAVLQRQRRLERSPGGGRQGEAERRGAGVEVDVELGRGQQVGDPASGSPIPNRSSMRPSIRARTSYADAPDRHAVWPMSSIV